MTETLRLGQLVSHLRKTRALMAQPALAAEIRRIWLKYLEDPELKFGKNAPLFETIRTALSEIENEKRKLRFPYTKLLAEVFEIPENIFSVPPKSFQSLNDRLEAYDNKRLNSKADNVISSEKSLPKRRFFSPQGLPRLNPGAVFNSRDDLVERLNQALSGAGSKSVILLKGSSGVGKSSLMRRWFERHSNTKKFAGFCIPCADKTGESILGELAANLRELGHPCGDLNEIEETLHKEGLIVVLDGLGPRMGGKLDFVASQRTHLIQFLIDFSSRQSNAKIVLVYASDLPNAGDLPSALSAAIGARILTLDVPPLNKSDGAQYLRNLNIVAGSPILERISYSLGGNPTDIFAFSQSIPSSKRSEPEYIERISFAIADVDRDDDEDKILQIFNDYVKKLLDDEPYQGLLLLVLASVRESILLDTCDIIINTIANAPRLRPHFLGSATPIHASLLAKSTIGNLLRQSSGRVELHARPRRLIARLVDRYISAELRALIHLMAARVLWIGLPRSPETKLSSGGQKYKPQETDVTALHDLIFHLMEIYEIFSAPEEQSRNTKSSMNVLHALELPVPVDRSSVPWFDPAALIEFAYNDVLLKGLSDERHVITRQLGDYEQKLSIMSMFLAEPTDGASLVNPKPQLSIKSQRQLTTDVSICALRSGRLSLAARAAGAHASQAFLDLAGDQWGALERAVLDDTHAGLSDAAQNLQLRSEILSTYATVLVRQGRLAGAQALLDGDVAALTASRPTIKVGMSREHPTRLIGRPREHLVGCVIAARRIVAKAAQIAFLQGDQKRSFEMFEKALEIEGWRTSPVLRGETGRTYCRAILGNAQMLNTAGIIIQDNLEFCKGLERYYEVLEWRIEEMCQARVANDQGAWVAAVSEAESLVKSRRIGLSFFAYWDLELEKIRGSTVFGSRARNHIRILESGISNLQDSGHRLLQCDSWLLLAEIDESRRAAHLQSARVLMGECGYLMRRNSLEHLERGVSILRMP